MTPHDNPEDVSSKTVLSLPKLLASLVDNGLNVGGRLIPSLSTILLLSLGENGDGSVEDGDVASPVLSSKRSQILLGIRTPMHQRHKYYLGTATGSVTSPTNTVNPFSGPSRVLRLSAQLKKGAVVQIQKSLPELVLDVGGAPDSPGLEPTSFSNSPAKILQISRRNNPGTADDLPKNISHLLLSGMGRAIQLCDTPASSGMSSGPRLIKGKGIESPLLLPVQTPASEVAMTPLNLGGVSMMATDTEKTLT